MHPRSQFMRERYQNDFEEACMYGDLDGVKKALHFGAVMSGTGLGRSARYALKMDVFQYLLAQGCPVTQYTWDLIARLPFSVAFANAICFRYPSRRRQLLLGAGISAASYADIPLFKFALSEVGWNPEFKEALYDYRGSDNCALADRFLLFRYLGLRLPSTEPNKPEAMTFEVRSITVQ